MHSFIFTDSFFIFAFEKGRGRNKDLLAKILPLFILPFLIQSAIVPFLVSTLKLLLIKSIVVGKIAIFLLLLSAFKNHVKYGYEAGPQFYPDVPNRRSEAHLTGYIVHLRYLHMLFKIFKAYLICYFSLQIPSRRQTGYLD